jgi:mono/diheme cytochrome c family protein
MRALALGVLVAAALSCGCAPRRPTIGRWSRYAGPIRSDDVERGRSRFEIVCAPCHVHHAILDAPALAGIEWSPGEVRHQIREGNAFMPAIPEARLSDPDIEPILAYLATIDTVVDQDREGTRGADALDAPAAP